MSRSYYDEFASRYEKPQVDDLIVGFSGIDPQRKGTGDGSGCECDSSTLTDSQRAIVRELIREALSVIDFSKCDCDPTQLTDAQRDIIRRLIEQELNELDLPECDCDPSSLSDEQQELIRKLIDERIKELIINYDGGEIDPENPDPEPEPAPSEPVKASDLSHEELKDLYGGNDEGHYHVTSDELLKLAGYPAYKELNHETLQRLLGGDEDGHYHLTEEELRKLRKLILAFFPDGSDEVIIKPVTPDKPDEPDPDPYDPYGGLPSGTAPGWELRMLPSGYEATEYAYKMYYGTQAGGSEEGLLVQMTRSSSSSKVGQKTSDLSTWSNGTAFSSVNNVYAYYYSPERKVIYYAGNPAKTGSGGGYVAKSGGGQLTATTGKINALCYSELLNVLLTATDAGEVRKVTISTSKHTISSAYNAYLTVNPGCAAWHPTTAVFCLTGLEGTSTSYDGETWTLNEEAPHNLLELTYREDLDCFVARSGEDKTFYASADGIEWHQLSDTPIPLETISTVNYNPLNGWYCAVGIGDGNAYFSKDLKHWVPTKLRNNSPVDVADVIYMPSTGLYVAMPTSGTYYYTFNPSNWTD